jgi:hypothetical protein
VFLSASIYTLTYIFAACINQKSDNPAEQLNGSMAQIIGSCDLVVTPVHDPHWRSWSGMEVKEIEDALTEYLAEGFVEYLCRGWCRLEMFFSANIPISTGRGKLFGRKLGEVICEEKRRPHLVFGTREKELGQMPLILRVLKDEKFEVYHPGKGNLTDPRDSKVIEAYVKELFNVNKRLRILLGNVFENLDTDQDSKGARRLQVTVVSAENLPKVLLMYSYIKCVLCQKSQQLLALYAALFRCLFASLLVSGQCGSLCCRACAGRG